MTEEELWERFTRIIRRHIRTEDAKRSDADFVMEVFSRFLNERKQPIIDVNE
jgi:hypothetical protein